MVEDHLGDERECSKLKNSISKILEAVVQPGGERVHRSFHQLVDLQLKLFLRQPRVEPGFEGSHGGRSSFEARELRAGPHDFHNGNDFITVFTRRH